MVKKIGKCRIFIPKWNIYMTIFSPKIQGQLQKGRKNKCNSPRKWMDRRKLCLLDTVEKLLKWMQWETEMYRNKFSLFMLYNPFFPKSMKSARKFKINRNMKNYADIVNMQSSIVNKWNLKPVVSIYSCNTTIPVNRNIRSSRLSSSGHWVQCYPEMYKIH